LVRVSIEKVQIIRDLKFN